MGGKVKKEPDRDRDSLHERSTTRGFVITRNFTAARLPLASSGVWLLVCDLLSVLSLGRMRHEMQLHL